MDKYIGQVSFENRDTKWEPKTSAVASWPHTNTQVTYKITGAFAARKKQSFFLL